MQSFDVAESAQCRYTAQSPDLNAGLLAALWNDVEAEVGKVWGRVSGPNASQTAAGVV